MEITFFFLMLSANEGQKAPVFAFIQSFPTCQFRVYGSSVEGAIEE